MDQLTAFADFIHIAESGSFSAVAREQGATQPAISRRIARLEKQLGIRLIQRSTRSLSLTDEGREFLEHARRVLAAVAEAEAAVADRRAAPSGLVRLTTPEALGRVLITPLIVRLLSTLPMLRLELVLSDAVIDLVENGIDVAIRAGAIADSALIARRIGSSRRCCVAAPAYLAAHGVPATPAELAGHECILFQPGEHRGEWQLNGPAGPLTVRTRGRLAVDALDAARSATLAGAGIAQLPEWLIREDLAAGRLQPLLVDFEPERVVLYALYPSRRFLAPRTRAVIDFLADAFALDPFLSIYGEA